MNSALMWKRSRIPDVGGLGADAGSALWGQGSWSLSHTHLLSSSSPLIFFYNLTSSEILSLPHDGNNFHSLIVEEINRK